MAEATKGLEKEDEVDRLDVVVTAAEEADELMEATEQDQRKVKEDAGLLSSVEPEASKVDDLSTGSARDSPPRMDARTIPVVTVTIAEMVEDRTAAFPVPVSSPVPVSVKSIR